MSTMQRQTVLAVMFWVRYAKRYREKTSIIVIICLWPFDEGRFGSISNTFGLYQIIFGFEYEFCIAKLFSGVFAVYLCV